METRFKLKKSQHNYFKTSQVPGKYLEERTLGAVLVKTY